MPVMADALGAESYGKYVIYKSISHQGIIAILALGVNILFRREFGKLKTRKASILDLKIVIQLVGAKLPLLLAISFLVPNEFSLSYLLIFSFLIIELSLVYLNSVLEGLRRVSLIRTFDLLQITTVIVGIIFFEFSIFECVLSIFCFNSLRLIGYLCLASNYSEQRISFNWSDIVQSAKYLLPANLFSILNNNFEKYLVAFLLASTQLYI